MMQSSQPEFNKTQQVKGMPGMRNARGGVSFHQSIDADTDRIGHSTSVTFTGGAKRKDRNAATVNIIGNVNSSTDTFKGNKKSSKSMVNKDNVSQKLQGQAKTIQPSNRRMTKTYDANGGLNNLTPRHSIINQQMYSTSKISLLANKLDKLKMYNFEARNIQKEQRKQYQKEIMEKYEPIFE